MKSITALENKINHVIKAAASVDRAKDDFFAKYEGQWSIADHLRHFALLRASRGTGEKVTFTPAGWSDAEIAEKWYESNLSPAARDEIIKTRNADVRLYLDELRAAHGNS